jgi:hypothetical protein
VREPSAAAALHAGRDRLLSESRPGAVPVLVAVGPDSIALVLPLAPGDDEGPAGERARRVGAAGAETLVVATGLAQPSSGADVELAAGTWQGRLALALLTADAAPAGELLELALDEASQALDRVRLEAIHLDGTLEADGLESPAWLWTAELAARLGARAGAARLPDDVADALTALAATRPPPPPPGVGSPHTDPLPTRRALRGILQRLDGMGKYGGRHTEFRHVARGFRGDELALALAAGEALLRAGLMTEKPSVGQRHVSLVAARTGDIRHLVDRGETSDPVLAAFIAGA